MRMPLCETVNELWLSLFTPGAIVDGEPSNASLSASNGCARSALLRMKIRWPSGAVDKLANVAADHFYAVLEGSGIVAPEKIHPAKH